MSGSFPWRFTIRRILSAIPLLVGVTLISFTLTVYFGPDKTWQLVGQNPTVSDVQQLRQELGYDRPFLQRYRDYIWHLARLDLGYTDSTGERVSTVLARTIPTSLGLLLPGFVGGVVLALVLAMLAAWYQGSWIDRFITGASITGMSLSFVIVIIGFQSIFSVWLGWFPVRGWAVHDLSSYLRHVTVPTLAFIFVSLGYYTRFFRALMVNELTSDYVLMARAYGAGPIRLMRVYVLGNCWLPIVARIIYSIPMLIISGSILLESHFSVPGIGRVAYEAILSGDQPLLMAVVALSGVLLVIAATAADVLCRVVDPRLELR